jgi:DNA polymerase/3'-5' exonuclease PolX
MTTRIDDTPFLPTPSPVDVPEIGEPAISGPAQPSVVNPSVSACGIPADKAARIAVKIITELTTYCATGKCVVAGSLRRLRPRVGDIDIVCEPRDWLGEHHQALRDRIKAHTRVLTDGQQNLIVTLAVPGLPDPVQIDVFFAKPRHKELFDEVPGNFGMMLLQRTGSKEHNIWLATRAESLGLKFSPYRGILRGNAVIASETEESIFRALELEPIAPERRER